MFHSDQTGFPVGLFLSMIDKESPHLRYCGAAAGAIPAVFFWRFGSWYRAKVAASYLLLDERVQDGR